MEKFVIFVHVAAAIFLIGPVTVTAMATPRAIRAGADGVGVLRWLHRTTRLYAWLSLLVFALGAALVPVSHHRWGEFWLSSSMTLFVVALGLLFGLVIRDQKEAVRRCEASEDATVQERRIVGVAGVVSLLWLVILVLMVYRWGS